MTNPTKQTADRIDALEAENEGAHAIIAAERGEVIALRKEVDRLRGALREACTSLVIAADQAREAAKTDSRWTGVDEKLMRYAREGQAALEGDQ